MVGVYVYLIKMGKRTIDQVPKSLRDEVAKALQNEK